MARHNLEGMMYMFKMTREEFTKRFEGMQDNITPNMTAEEMDEVFRQDAALALTKDEYRQYILNEKLIDSVTEFINTDYNDVEDFQYNFNDWSYKDLLEANDYYAREMDHAAEVSDRCKEKKQQATDEFEQELYATMRTTFAKLALTYAVAGLVCHKEKLNRME
jgi:hypothetical protein